ncbi:MAG TPA: amidohydrolase family protein [Chloroflexota bacterium]
MELKYGLISVDDHVLETPDVWTARMSKAKWGDRIPHLIEQADGSQCWAIDGSMLPLAGNACAGAAMPDRAINPTRWSEVPPSTYVPSERLRAMDTDGVDASVLYPTVAGIAGETFGRITDAELELACVQAYNDWLVEEWSSASPRFIPQCLVPLAPIESTVREIQRAVANGHRGAIIPPALMQLRDLPHINEPVYDPVWAVCQEMGVPVCFHAGSSKRLQFPPYSLTPRLADALEAVTRPITDVPIMANLLFSRILLRFPTVKVVFAESSLAWGAYEIEFADHEYERQRMHLEGYDLKPSEMFRRQCYLGGWYDRAGIDERSFLGVGNLLWETNYPQANSSWPQTGDFVSRLFEGVPEDEKATILAGNAAQLYKL